MNPSDLATSPISLLAVADRLEAIARTLHQVPGAPEGLAEEIQGAARRCWSVFYRVQVTLECFDRELLHLGQLRDQLGRDVAEEVCL